MSQSTFRARLCHTLVKDWLAQIEFELLGVKSASALAGHPWAPGKRLRPITFLLSYLSSCVYLGKNTDFDLREVRLGAAIELMHEASLVHDDLVDRSSLRRGAPTVQMTNGAGRALLMGDYMVFRALKMALDSVKTENEIRLAQELADTGLGVAHGELEQLDAFLNAPDPTLRMSEGKYLDLIGKKTAMFFAGCAEGGAALAGADQRTRELFHRFGMTMGIAFQVIDDMIDVFGDAETAKKTLANNLSELTVTLPFIVAFEVFPADEGLVNLAHARPLTQAEQTRTLGLFASEELRAKCALTLQRFLADADAAVLALPGNAFTLGLGDLLDYVKKGSWGGLDPSLLAAKT